jgi:hypothetical protein
LKQQRALATFMDYHHAMSMNPNSNTTRIVIAILILLNCLVLIGQLWPEGEPPFARTVNIIFLILSLLFFASLLIRRKATLSNEGPVHAEALKPAVTIFTLCILFAVESMGQNADVSKRSHQGVFVHLIGTTQVFGNELGESKFRPGVGFGIYQHFDIGARTQLRIGGGISCYQIDETDYTPMFGDDVDQGTGRVDVYKSYLHQTVDIVQINLPVNVRYKLWGLAAHAFLAVGIEGRYVVKDKFKARIQESGNGFSEFNTEPFYASRKLNIAAQLELGYEFPFGTHKLNVSIIGKHSLASQFEGFAPAFAQILKGRALDLGIGLGLIF